MAEEQKNLQTNETKPLSEMEKKLRRKDRDGNVALRWFGSHLLAELFCLLLLIAFLSLTQVMAIQALIELFVFLLYVMLMGTPAWTLGNHDRNRVKYGHKKEDLSRGFRVGFLASLPLWIAGICVLFAKAEFLPNFYPIYKIVNGHVLLWMNLADKTFFGAPSAYLTMDSWFSIILVVLTNGFTMLITGVHYILGYKDIEIMTNIMYKKKR